MKIALAIASRARAELLAVVLPRWVAQSRPLDAAVLSVTSDFDLPVGKVPHAMTVVSGGAGLCSQRNRALDQLEREVPDVVIFADDDFIPAPDFVTGVERVFTEATDVAVATGWVLVDGGRGDVASIESADRLIAVYATMQPVELALRDTTGGYGCNMAVRWSVDRSLRFDERLALYGWQEDIDFTRRFRRNGRIVSTRAFAGVHLGFQGARLEGTRLGYSQMINPAYLILKGTMPIGFGLRLMFCNLLANAKGAVLGDAAVDRQGRLKGNVLGLFYLLTGRIAPEEVVRL